MERTVKINNRSIIKGFAYDSNNNVLAKGEFLVKKDGPTMQLKQIGNKGSNKVFTIPKERFDMDHLEKGEDTKPRRVPISKGDRELEEARYRELKKITEEINRRVASGEPTNPKRDFSSTIIHGTKDAIVTYESHHEIINLINAGIKNIWLVGPAGSGKSVIVKNVAKKLNKKFLPISCGAGTSSSEFQGYKYPERSETPFGIHYRKPGVILLDEFTSLDAQVAQVANSALANGFINTTTGIVHRHHNCIIIATSNTFGTGADPQYVANNVLDASTLDRFIGGIIEIGYSESYERRFDPVVRKHVETLRRCIDSNYLRKIASTRMMIVAERLKKLGLQDWRERLITSWTDDEKGMLAEFIKQEKQDKVDAEKKRLKELVNGKNEVVAENPAVKRRRWDKPQPFGS